MSGGDGFLSRWSRRKLELGLDEPARADHLPQAAGPATEAAALGEPSATMSPEEVSRLPRVEDLTPESDFSQFLQGGVPELLRNTALRRLWSLEPGIRDFVGDARDYAWDWNLPGAVPVAGPLLPGDDPAAMLARMFGTQEDTGVAGGSSGQPSSPAIVSSADMGPPGLLPERLADPTGERDSIPGEDADKAPREGEICAEEVDRERPATRRHGSASPTLE